MKKIFLLIVILYSSFSSHAQIELEVPPELSRQLRPALDQRPAFTRSVMYPATRINGRDLEKALFFITTSRQRLTDFLPMQNITAIPDYDQDPEGVKQILQTHIDNLKEMRSDLYVTKAYIRNGGEVLDAIKTLKSKSNLVVKHIDRYAPWPVLDEVRNPPITIKDIMPECCDYFYWYNSYLFLAGHAYEVEDPMSNFKLKISFTDEKVYEEKFKTGYLLTSSFDNIRERLLFSREIIKTDINSLINLLDTYERKMESYAERMPGVLSRNETVYKNSGTFVENYIKSERDEASKWIAETSAVSARLRDSVTYYDSMITVHSRQYYGLQQQISYNELLAGSFQNQVTYLTDSSFVLMNALDSLRKVSDRLLAGCNDQDATDDCVRYPDSLKAVNAAVKVHFEAFTDISDRKNHLSDSILYLAELNDSLSTASQTAYELFAETRNQYYPVAAAYQENQRAIKDGMIYHREKFHVMSTLFNKLQIVLGKKEDPLMVRIRATLQINRYRPRIGPLVPPDITDPDNPWNPGWIDPVRDDLLRELDIQDINIDLNRVERLRGN